MIKNIRDKHVFHGSYCIVKNPNIVESEEGKDFGVGFYITTDYRQSIAFAKNKAKRMKLPVGYVNIYDISNLDNLKVFEFTEVDKNWLNCIVGFRNKSYAYLAMPYEQYDVIIGKIADDNTSLVINAYMTGVYGEVGTDSAVNTAITLLKPENLRNQLCLRNMKAISRLRFYKYEEHLV